MLGRKIARRHDAAVDAPAFVGEPLDDVSGGQHFDACFGERLALFLRHQARDVGGAFTHQTRGFAHGRGTFVGGNLAPGFEALLRGGECAVEIGDASVGNFADRLAGSRVDDLDGFTAGGVAPLVVDQESGVGIA